DRGTVLTSDTVIEPTLLVGVLNEVRDSTGTTVNKRFGYSLVSEAGAVSEAGPAPYLDYAPADERLREQVASLDWLGPRERDAVSWVITEQLPAFTAEVTARRSFEFERVRDRVNARLTGEINRLETDALKADQQAASGKKV